MNGGVARDDDFEKCAKTGSAGTDPKYIYHVNAGGNRSSGKKIGAAEIAPSQARPDTLDLMNQKSEGIASMITVMS